MSDGGTVYHHAEELSVSHHPLQDRGYFELSRMRKNVGRSKRTMHDTMFSHVPVGDFERLYAKIMREPEAAPVAEAPTPPANYYGPARSLGDVLRKVASEEPPKSPRRPNPPNPPPSQATKDWEAQYAEPKPAPEPVMVAPAPANDIDWRDRRIAELEQRNKELEGLVALLRDRLAGR